MSYRNKNTGEIVTLHCRSWSSRGNTVTFYDGEGLPTTIPENQFNQEYTEEIPDYKAYKDNIMEACYLNKDFQRLANVVLRRLDPDYLKKDAIVYFEHPEHYFKKDLSYVDYGPEKPYKIFNITPDKEGRCFAWVYLARLGKTIKKDDWYEEDFKLQIHYDTLEPNDAYWNLKRYDKPY